MDTDSQRSRKTREIRPVTVVPSQSDTLLPRDEARARLGGIGLTLLNELLLTGTIASAKIGRRRLVSANSLERYIGLRLQREEKQ